MNEKAQSVEKQMKKRIHYPREKLAIWRGTQLFDTIEGNSVISFVVDVNDACHAIQLLNEVL